MAQFLENIRNYLLIIIYQSVARRLGIRCELMLTGIKKVKSNVNYYDYIEDGHMNEILRQLKIFWKPTW